MEATVCTFVPCLRRLSAMARRDWAMSVQPPHLIRPQLTAATIRQSQPRMALPGRTTHVVHGTKLSCQ